MAKRQKIKLDTKERSAADRYEIMPYTTDMTSQTMELGGKKFPWGRQGAVHVKDGGEAQALQDKYGDRVITMKVSSPDIHDRGHRYFFGNMPALPWAKYDEFGRRVYDGETEGEEESPSGLQERAEADSPEVGRINGTSGGDPGGEDAQRVGISQAQEPAPQES